MNKIKWYLARLKHTWASRLDAIRYRRDLRRAHRRYIRALGKALKTIQNQ